MTRPPTRLLLWCGIAPALVIALLCVGRPRLLMNLESGVYDVMVRAMPAREPSGRVVVVDVDERSLAAVGQWPWPRDRMAELIDGLQDLGAEVVALDVVFAEPERNGDTTAAHAEAALVGSVASPRVVLGYGLRFGDAGERNGCGRRSLDVAVLQRAGDDALPPLFRASGAVCNLPALDAAAGGAGFLNAAPDRDGILRRVPLVIDLHGRPSPSLALAAVSKLLGSDAAVLQGHNAHAAVLRMKGDATRADEGSARNIPLDGRGNLLLRYRGGKGTLRHVSAVDVLNRAVRPAEVRGRIAFIGTTALGTREVVATPLDTLFSGVEVQGTVADNLLQQDFLYRPQHAGVVETALLLLLGGVTALAVRRWGALRGMVGAGALMGILWIGATSLLFWTGMLVSPLYPTIAVAGTLAAMTGARLSLEGQRADRASHDSAMSQSLMVEALLGLTAMRDAETGQHSRRIQHYARLLAEQLRQHPDFREYLTDERVVLLSTLAALHDIGKVGIPDGVLNKAGPLNAAEFAEMQRHPTYGRDVIVDAERVVGSHDDATLALAKDIVYTHHEKWDGTGYPERLRGTEIPIAGRLIAVVDVYDAVVTHRPYRRAMTHDQAQGLIVQGSGTHFDPRVVEAFLAVSPAFRALSQLGDEGVDRVEPTLSPVS